MTPLSIAVGRRVRHLRKARRMTQHELAERVGTYREIVARLERGVHVPRLRVLAEYADALRVPIWAIVNAVDGVPVAVRGRHQTTRCEV